MPYIPQVIVCGLGRAGYRIFMLLRQQGAQVVGISDKPLDIGDSAIVVGNLRSQDTLKAASIEQAHTLLLASSDDALNLAILTQARLLNPKIRIINRLFNASLGERLDQTLPQHVSMSVAALAGPLFAFAALGNRAIGQIELFGTTWAMHEEYIDADHPWNGRLLKSLWEDRGRMLIYYHSSTAEIDLISAVLEGEVLHTGDRLIVATRPQLQKPRSQPMPYLCMAGGLLWVAIATLITPHHPFCSKSIQSVAKQADLVPLYLETRGQTLHGFALLNAILNSGDILYLTLPAHGLEQLWRHTSLLVSP
nr:NAD-binding protein [Pseudanabaena sp. FACHB-2040]